MRSVGESAQSADKILELKLGRNQVARSASRIISGNSNVCN